jgi:predicted anti-sigma-YlaC factor YlaD
MGQSSQMSCSEVRKQLPSFLNEAVDMLTAQRMHWHFGHCKDCRMILQSAMATFRQFFLEKRTANSLYKSHAA